MKGETEGEGFGGGVGDCGEEGYEGDVVGFDVGEAHVCER